MIDLQSEKKRNKYAIDGIDPDIELKIRRQQIRRLRRAQNEIFKTLENLRKIKYPDRVDVVRRVVYEDCLKLIKEVWEVKK